MKRGIRLIAIMVVLVLLTAFIGGAGAVSAKDKDEGVPDPGIPPKGMAVKVFLHPVKGEANAQDKAGAEAPTYYWENPRDNKTMFAFSGIRWPQQHSPINIYVNFNVSTVNSLGLTGTKAHKAIILAFETWDSAQFHQVDGKRSSSGPLYYLSSFHTTAIGPKLDGKNVLSWRNLPRGIVAITYVWYYAETLSIAEFDMVFNDSYRWAYTEPAGIDNNPLTYEDPTNIGPNKTFDLRDIATHEFGHTMMLDDVYDVDPAPGEELLTMYAYANYRELLKDTLQRGDHVGVCYIYP